MHWGKKSLRRGKRRQGMKRQIEVMKKNAKDEYKNIQTTLMHKKIKYNITRKK